MYREREREISLKVWETKPQGNQVGNKTIIHVRTRCSKIQVYIIECFGISICFCHWHEWRHLIVFWDAGILKWQAQNKSPGRSGFTVQSVINQLTDDRWQDCSEHENISRKTASSWRLNLWHFFQQRDLETEARTMDWHCCTGRPPYAENSWDKINWNPSNLQLTSYIWHHDWKPTFIKHLASLATGSTSWHWAQPHSMLQSHH